MPSAASSFTSTADGLEIATCSRTEVAGAVVGAVQIVHGLAEHAARHDRLARALYADGVLAYATDRRGHGRTGQDALGNFGVTGFDGLIADVAQFGTTVSTAQPDLPLFLLAHSMGSFAAQSVIIDQPRCFPTLGSWPVSAPICPR